MRQNWRMAYESPTYRIEERIGKIELHRYEPYVVAETLVEGSLERAGNGGFRRLAGYIFGGNEMVRAAAFLSVLLGFMGSS